MVVTFSPPTEEDAIPLQERYDSKQMAKEKLGEPIRTKSLNPTEANPCVERWFYTGKANIEGLGPIDLLMYVDFGPDGKSCASAKSKS